MEKHAKTKTVNKNNAKIINKKSKKNINNGFRIFVLTIILCAAIVSGYFAPKISNTIEKLGGGKQGIVAMMLGHTEETRKNLSTLYFVLIGESGEENYKLSDTIIICSYDPKTQKASMLSIPRDTYVGTNIESASASYKINARYNNGERMDTLFSDLKKITGLDLKYYVRINTKALIKLVDLVGGVEFNVPIDMKYDDPTQNLHINLKKGMQTITGAKAEQLLRFRHSNNGQTYPSEYGEEDLGRMHTQREFITATISQAIQKFNIEKANELIDLIFKEEYIATNFNLDEVVDYIPYTLEFKTEDLKKDVLPGQSLLRNGVWIYSHDKNKTKEVVKDLFLNNQEQ